MIRLFLPPHQLDLAAMSARIEGQDHQHLARVLRCRPDDVITLLDGAGAAYRARLTSVEKDASVATLEERIAAPPEPEVFITVGQALGKSDKFEQVVQHGTEAGASAFFPVQADRSVASIPPDRLAERLGRWRAIAKGAAEQSFRARIPDVAGPMRLEAFLSANAADGPVLLLHAGEHAARLNTALSQLTFPPLRCVLLVGPEGGWSDQEMAAAALGGCRIVSLGPRVLRTETAALVAVSQLLYHYSRPEETSTCVS